VPTDLLNRLQVHTTEGFAGAAANLLVVQCLIGDVRPNSLPRQEWHSLQLFRKFVGENFELVNLGCLVKQITGLGFFH
jgi:hypothetical protein